MKNSIIIGLLLASFTVFGQIPSDPIPPKPGEQPLDGPQTESKTTISKQTPEQALAQQNTAIAQLATVAPGGLNPGRNPQASPESNFINRFQDIPINLYTGTPIINFPIYTLSEPGGASVPIGLSFNASGMKAHDVASWVGMNWTFYVGGQITRIVRGIPDEGRYTLDGSYNTTARKGYFKYGLKADNNDENDSQADIYFLNINDQSYKFTFDVNRKAHFFPEADIDVSVQWEELYNVGDIVGRFRNWKITMPDGTKYFFAETATEIESNFEIEANQAVNGSAGYGSANFDKYASAEKITSTWYLTKIESAYGHQTIFEYHPSLYSYYKLAEQSTTTFDCTFSTISKKINKNYIQSSVLYKISNNNIVVEFNKGGWESSTNEYGNEYWYLNTNYPKRNDLDAYGRLPENSSAARALHKISVYDKASPENIIEWQLKYGDQTSTEVTIPFSYNSVTVGTTHERRFKLKSITEPDGNYYFFKYYSEDFNLPSRFTQGVDHWGYLNGANGATNLIGEDAFRSCTSNQFSNRSATTAWSQYGTLTDIIHSSGGTTLLEYENHDARNYPNIIGGSRVKKTTFIDSVSNIKNIKTYSYLQNNGQSSGFLTLKPVYHFDDISDGTINQYWVSSLYQQLLSESGRPAVGYSNVKESIVDQSSNLLGYTKSDFSQPLTAPTIQQKIPINCVTTIPPNGPPVTTCDTLVKMRPYKWNPYHDNTIGAPTRIAVYNASNQMLSEKSMVYGEGPQGTYTDQTAYRSFRMENQNYNFVSAYYDASNAFRQYSDTTKAFSLDGTKPITTINQYIYKDQMDNAYKAIYPGKHNQLVKTISTNSLGHQIESLTKYAADFSFGSTVPTDLEAKGVYQLQQKHIIGGVVESITKQNGNITGAGYQSYYDDTALPKSSYSIENLPRASITEVNYTGSTWTKDSDYDLKNTVTSYNPIALPIAVTEKYGSTSKIDYDATNSLPIKTYKNFGAVDQQTTQTEYSKKIFGISKEIGTNGLEVRKEFYANGKLKQVLDKDNNVLKHYTYLYRGTKDAVLKTDSSKNRIITRVPRISTTDATALSYTNCQITIQYLDGAGRTLETVAYKASPNAKSIISGATGFDTFGRAIRNYLPIESDYDDGQFVDTTAINTKATAFYGANEICYSEVIYENSPLSRPLKSYGVGTAFRAANKYSESKYETIDTEAGLKKITALAGENKGFIGSYTSNQLFKKTSIDERGSAVIEYSDKSGNVIRRDVQSTDTEHLTTAYVFDDANRLRYVLPPNAYNIIKNQAEFDEADPNFNEMIYAYHYDGRNRVYETHTPGTGWSRVVYNRLNQPVLTQDDDEASTNTWNFAQTDGQSRSVRTGQIQTGDSRLTLQDYFDNYVIDSQFEERSTTADHVAQYTNRSFPTQLRSLITEQSLKTVAYYDNYDWRNGINASTGTATDYDFQPNTLNTATPYSKTNSAVGLNTGGLIKDDLNGDLLMPSISYFDDKNRSIQSIAFTHLHARDQTDTKYNFNGEVAKSKAIYRQTGKADITRTTSHTYDHMSRPKTLLYGLSLYNGGAEFPMNFFAYDALGRMKTKYVQPSAAQIGSTEQTGLWNVGTTWQGGSTPNLQTLAIINAGHSVNIPNNASVQASSLINNGLLTMGTSSVLTLGSIANVNRVALQTIDYSYNIRSQLRGVNLDASDNLQISPEKLFSYKLDYHEDGRYYDGNISKQSWKSQRSPDTRTYTYTYDRSNRVNDASYTGKGSEAYGVSNITYDIMGNLKTMNRNGKTGTSSWGEVDKLAYSYNNSGNSNKLQQVDDTGVNASAGGFKDGNSGRDYGYTTTGKITSDLNKGINLIEYNFLDLVKKQTFTDNRIVEYGYSTTGQRRTRKVTKDGQTNYTFYNGEIVYASPDNNPQNATITEIQNIEGRFVGGQFTYGYTDQVGNLRLSYRDSILATGGLTSIVVQENAYDVWGNELDGLGFVRGQKDNYLVTGKETDNESGNVLLDWRDYDPTTGRMKNPDPAGQSQMQSGFAYCGNNPVSFVDPDGQFFFMPILMTAIFSGHLAGMFSDNYGKAFVRGFVAGGLGGVAGAFAPIGFLPGMAYGAGTGGIVGGIGSAMGGGSFWTGAKSGAIFGGIGGGISGGIGALNKGADFWTGYRAPSGFSASEANSILKDTPEGGPVKKSDYRAFVKKQFPEQSNLFGSAKDKALPKGVSILPDGAFGTPGDPLGALGLTQGQIWSGGNSAKVYISDAAFKSEAKLFLTVGHEFTHAQHHLDGLMGAFTSRNTKIISMEDFATYNFDGMTERSAYMWTVKAAQTNGWSSLAKGYTKLMLDNNYGYELTSPAFNSRVNLKFRR